MSQRLNSVKKAISYESDYKISEPREVKLAIILILADLPEEDSWTIILIRRRVLISLIVGFVVALLLRNN